MNSAELLKIADRIETIVLNANSLNSSVEAVLNDILNLAEQVRAEASDEFVKELTPARPNN